MSDNYDAGVADFLKSPNTPPTLAPALKLSMGDAQDTKPDYEAELRRAAAATGVPIDTARADPKATLDQHKVESLNLDGLALTHPGTANFLANPDNARIAHDDVSALAQVEQTLKNLGDLGKASFWAAASGAAGYLQATAPFMRSIGVESPISGEADDPNSDMGKFLTEVRKASKAASVHYMPQTDNPWAAGVNSGVVSLMQAAPVTLGAALTKNPGMAIGAFGALAGGEGYGDAKDAGKSDATAQRYAGTQGAIAMLAQAIPLHELLGDVEKGTGFFKTLGKNLLLSQPAMQAQTLASDFDTWVTLNPDKPMSEFLKERGPAALNTMIATAIGDVANTSAAHAGARLSALAGSDGENAGKAVQAQQQGVILQRLTEAAKASKLRDRDPQAFHDFVAKATEDGPVESVYIDPRHVTDVLAQGDPQKLATDVELLKAMPSVLPQMDEALRTGQDVKIPTAEFAAYAAGSDFAQELLPHLKTDPNGMSLAESETFLQDHAEELKAQVRKIVAESGQDDATQVSAAKVKDAVLAQLKEANRFTPDVNDAYAHMTAAFYSTMAQRLGITPEAMYEAHPVKIAAEDVSGGARLDQFAQMSKEDFQKLLADSRAATTKRKATTAELSADDAPVRFGQDSGRRALVSPDLEQPGRWRLTRIDEAGPSGHTEYATKAEAVEDALREKYEPLMRDASGGAKLDQPKGTLDWTPGGGSKDTKIGDSTLSYGVGADGTAEVISLRTPVSKRGNGSARKAMEQFLAEADAQGRTVTLMASALDKRTNQGKLEQFYKSLGFEPTGRRINMAGDPEMRREPQTPLAQDAVPTEDAKRAVGEAVADFAAQNGVRAEFALNPIRINGERDLELTDFYADTPGAGGGTKTMQHLAALADEAGVSVYVHPESPRNKEFYGRFDFERSDTHGLLVRYPAFDHEDLAQGEKAPRGSYNPNTNLISLLKGADLSTYLHESGHFYLETLARVAASHPDSELAADMDKALAFMGHKGMTAAEWLAEPLEARREGHELFARGFEAYLMEGKAPSQELRGVFQRFRAWLGSVYKTMAGLKVELTPDVRGVFDRMLASQQEIENREAAQHFAPIFKDAEAAGMNPQEWEAYQRLGADATATAVDQLETRSIRDMRWLTGARDRAVRQLQREARTRRKAVEGEVTGEVMAEPINRARQLLRYGTLDGQEVEGHTKLSLPDLKEMYGEAGTALEETVGQKKLAVDYRKLGYGKYGMLAEEGLHPDHVAELLGFSSGDELVRALLDAPELKSEIEGRTDQRMLERYGDLVDADAIQKAADEALHNDARLRFVATEANALAKAAGQRRVLAEAAQGYAADMISRVKVRDLKPSRYQMAETRAAAASAKAAAKGDLVTAATEKRNQVVNAYAARAAMDAQAEVAKALRFFARFDSAGTRKALDPDYRDQIDSLLERFDLSKSTTLRAIDKRKSLMAWVERMKANDQEPMIPEELLDAAYRKSFKDMTMDEVRGLRDTVAQIAHLARLKNRLLSAKNARDFASTIEAATTEVEKSAIGKPRDLTESNQIGDKIEAGARGFAVMHRKFDSLITRLAGFVDKRDPGNASTLWSVLVRPKNEAADREATRIQRSTEELQRIFKALAPDRVRQKVFIPEINNSLSLEGRLAVLLNWGNESNRQRVVDGDHWTDAQVQAIFKTLEPRHFAFAQELLDHVNSFKGEVASAHRRRYGVEPPMIEAAPFSAVASDGSTVEMRGGYYPLKYDPNRSAKAAEFDAMKEAKKAIIGSTRGFVKAGFYKERADTVENRPVSKSFNAAFSHLTEVIHDLEWGDYLIDAKRLLGNETLGNSIRVHAGPEILASLKSAVQAMEVGDIPAQNAFQKAVQYLNTGTTLAGLGWNFIVSTKHPLGLFNGAARIGPQWIGVGLKRWIGDTAQMQNTVEWVHSKSEFMKSRAHGRLVTRDLQDVSGKMTTGLTSDFVKILGGAKAADALHTTGTAIEHSFYWMIERGQMIADVPTWIGQYEKSMQAHGDDAMAVQQANQAVRDSQTTGGLSDLPEIQRGGPLMKLFTKFYSYFTVVYNQLAESAEETRFRGVSNVPALAGDVMLALVLPALAGAAIQRMLPGGDEREDWAKYLGDHMMADLFGTMIGVRDLYAAFTEDKDAPAGFRFMKNTADLGKLVEKGETNTPHFWKALNAEGGVLFHYPSATVQRFVTGVQAMAEGQTHNPLVLLTGPHPKPR